MIVYTKLDVFSFIDEDRVNIPVNTLYASCLFTQTANRITTFLYTTIARCVLLE